MSTSGASEFERSVLASGLLDAAQVEQACVALQSQPEAPWTPGAPDADQRLADKLVELNLLNRWQAEQLMQGRTKFNLGPYWIIDSLGQGGMGQVFKAEHGVMSRVVAIKVLPRSRSTPEAIANFTREIRLLAKLDHPSLVRALDAGHDGNVYFLVTEFVPGTDLRRLVRKVGPLPVEAAARIGVQVAAGLQHAHDQGLIHRDVKPANILVTPQGDAKLLDLGLSGPMEGDEDTRFGKIVGTADYLSPDHIQAPWDPRPAWDIYSLGCTLYYAVTGKVPFPGGTTRDKARAHCELTPADPRTLVSTLPTAFVEVIQAMMAKDPAQRTPTAADVIARLMPWTEPGGQRSLPTARRGANLIRGFGLSDFPEMPEPGDGSGSSSHEWYTQPLSGSTEETIPLAAPAAQPQSGSLMRPLVVLVGLPLLLAVVATVVCWALALLAK